MNNEEIDKTIAMLQAMRDSARVEFKNLGTNKDWQPLSNPSAFYFERYEYRAVFPKLTADVFERDDCPAWGKYAAVDKNGHLLFFGNQLFDCAPEPTNVRWTHDGKLFMATGEFDATDWQNSLIERPAKIIHWSPQDIPNCLCGEKLVAGNYAMIDKSMITCEKCLDLLETKLPEWCKVGEKVFVDEAVEVDEIENIRGQEITTKRLRGYYPIDRFYPAVRRLPTIDEIFQRPSLAVKNKNRGDFRIIAGSTENCDAVLIYGRAWMIQSLADEFTWADGTPIGKWVKGEK